jgi:phosphatidylglycerophosphate synthase
MIARAYRRSIQLGAIPLVRAGVSPNQVSLLSIAVVVAGCAVFVATRAPLAFAPLVLLGGFLDALDGEVARRSRRVTRFGGYLDAVCDRVFDSAVLLAIAWVSGRWPVCMLAVIGSYSVSYSKARAALELPIANTGWPDLLGREARIVALVAGLAAWGLAGRFGVAGSAVIAWWLAAMTVGLFITAAQRFRHAYVLLTAADRSAPR